MDKDLVSIIIPVYNVEKYIGICLDSIINQTYKNIEIILIDDGSTDNSLKIIKQYQSKDKRIKVINRENKGVLYTRVEGFKIAKGRYITYIDSDDWAENNMIEIMYNKAIEYNADVVKCGFGYNDFESAVSKIESDTFITQEQFEPTFYDKLFRDMNIHNVWAQLFKKELLDKSLDNIDTTISLGDDLELDIQLYKNISNILFISNILYHYRYNANSITKSLRVENVKKNIESVTKAYFNAYKSIDYFDIKDKIKYKQSSMIMLLKEVINSQIDLIGAIKNRKESIEYLKWYYNEYDIMQQIKAEIDNINPDINNFKYKSFYKYLYTNINISYLLAKLIFIRRILKRKIKKV